MKRNPLVAVVLVAALGSSCGADRGVREEPANSPAPNRGVQATGTIKLPDMPQAVAVVSPGTARSNQLLAVTSVRGGGGSSLALYDRRTLRKVSQSIGSDVAQVTAAGRYVWLRRTSALDLSVQLDRIQTADLVLDSGNQATLTRAALSAYPRREIGLPAGTEIIAATRRAVWLATTPGEGPWSVVRVDAASMRTTRYAVPRGSLIAGLPDGFAVVHRVGKRFVLERRRLVPEALATRPLRGSWRPVGWPAVGCGRSLWSWVRSGTGALVARAGETSTARSRALVTTSRGEQTGPIALSGCRDLWVTVERDRGTAATIYRLDARTLRVLSSVRTPPVDAIAAGPGAAWVAIGQSHAVLRLG